MTHPTDTDLARLEEIREAFKETPWDDLTGSALVLAKDVEFLIDLSTRQADQLRIAREALTKIDDRMCENCDGWIIANDTLKALDEKT